MKEKLAELLASKDTQFAVILAAFYGLNAVLTGIKKALDRFKDKTDTQLDNQAADILGRLSGAGSKIIEFLTANSTALPAKARAEIEKKD